MKITRISKRKNRRLYDIFIDDEPIMSVSSKKVLDKFGLEPGLVIQPEEFYEVKKNIELFEAENILLQFLSYRFRSKKEIQQKLRKKRISQSAIDQLIEKYEQKGFINDDNFAESYILDLISHHPQGSYSIKQKLRQKGISNEIIQRLSEEYLSQENEYDMAVKELTKKKSKYMKMEHHERRNKALAFLQRKGFSYSCARASVEEVLSGSEES
ncbi:MAG: RecX family transcriptional regulator [Candidatus Cloacimonetes bacterium]|nr:RecX family transcriptional regulator [Candidatus Cloacimonadota bacterium]